MRTIILTLTMLAALIVFIAYTPQARAEEDMGRAFGLTLGKTLPLSSKQVQGVGSPGFGLERYMLLFIPASLPPYARHYATVDARTKRIAALTGITRKLPSEKKAWETFQDEISRLEATHGTGMRLGGGTLWKVIRNGKSITLILDLQAHKLTIRLADERRLGHSMTIQ